MCETVLIACDVDAVCKGVRQLILADWCVCSSNIMFILLGRLLPMPEHSSCQEQTLCVSVSCAGAARGLAVPSVRRP